MTEQGPITLAKKTGVPLIEKIEAPGGNQYEGQASFVRKALDNLLGRSRLTGSRRHLEDTRTLFDEALHGMLLMNPFEIISFHSLMWIRTRSFAGYAHEPISDGHWQTKARNMWIAAGPNALEPSLMPCDPFLIALAMPTAEDVERFEISEAAFGFILRTVKDNSFAAAVGEPTDFRMIVTVKFPHRNCKANLKKFVCNHPCQDLHRIV
jgi:hypothetical protein